MPSIAAGARQNGNADPGGVFAAAPPASDDKGAVKLQQVEVGELSGTATVAITQVSDVASVHVVSMSGGAADLNQTGAYSSVTIESMRGGVLSTVQSGEHDTIAVKAMVAGTVILTQTGNENSATLIHTGTATARLSQAGSYQAATFHGVSGNDFTGNYEISRTATAPAVIVARY